MTDAKRAERFDVIIAGASYTGAALALALAQAFRGEARIAVLDRAARSGVSADARAFALSAASRRMLERLGVWGRLAGEPQEVTSIEITDSSLEAGVRPVLLSYDNRVGEDEPATFIVPATALDAALAEALAGESSETLIAPAEITGLKLEEAGAEIALGDGRRLATPLIVAADGRRSTLREMAGIRVVGWQSGQTGIVTTISHTRPHEARAVQHFLPGGPFAMLPLNGNRSCITWSETAAEAQRVLALDDEAFLAEVEKRVGGRLGTISLAGPRQSWPLDMHLAESYVAARFALVGDAAHGVHPIAGQGLNLAFRDVAALTEVVIDAARIGLDIGSLETLKRYERWRRFDAAASTAAYEGLNAMFSNDWTLARVARDFGLALVDRTPAVKRFFVAEGAGTSGELPRLLRGEAA